ncbi:hypothetical protein ACJMK2_035108 [Sinanodonta woodiana]|uniref:Uncharacterized protein n=1 Tax=Sinanodonta woodiana TaxID=1069815 RepID=A0ABD3WTU4_SINWO
MASMMNSMASGMNYMMGKMTDSMNCAADVMMLKSCQTNVSSNIVQPVSVTTTRTQMPPDTSKTSTAFQAEPVSTTTQKTPLKVYPCNKYQSINIVAHESSIVNKRAGSCSRQDRNNPDALVIRLCTAPNVTTWIKGAKVLDYCDRIPLFSAVATFVNDHHYTGGYSGIFAGCLRNGFKIILQTCQNAPSVIHITLDTMNNVDYNTDPVNYYILNW